MTGMHELFYDKQAASLSVVRMGVCLILSAAMLPLYAEDLRDPTRPPASVFEPSSNAGRGAVIQPRGLQMIIISKQRRAAIIDGQTVELGGRHGKATLIEVNEGNVVLQRASGRQVLSLFPGVKITNKVLTGKSSANMESPNKEMQIDKMSSASEVPAIQNTGPAARKEEK